MAGGPPYRTCAVDLEPLRCPGVQFQFLMAGPEPMKGFHDNKKRSGALSGRTISAADVNGASKCVTYPPGYQERFPLPVGQRVVAAISSRKELPDGEE
jgi:hypothetical protein